MRRRFVQKVTFQRFYFRARVQTAYQMFSRRTPKRVHASMKGLGADYLVFEYNWCMKNLERYVPTLRLAQVTISHAQGRVQFAQLVGYYGAGIEIADTLL